MTTRTKGIVGALLWILLGLVTVVLLGFRRDWLFWIAVAGWVVLILGVLLLALFTVGWTGRVTRFSLAALALVFITVASVTSLQEWYHRYALEKSGIVTVATIETKELRTCILCDQGLHVRIRFTTEDGQAVEYWHPCHECLSAEKVLVRYSRWDPYINEIIRPLSE